MACPLALSAQWFPPQAKWVTSPQRVRHTPVSWSPVSPVNCIVFLYDTAPKAHPFLDRSLVTPHPPHLDESPSPWTMECAKEREGTDSTWRAPLSCNSPFLQFWWSRSSLSATPLTGLQPLDVCQCDEGHSALVHRCLDRVWSWLLGMSCAHALLSCFSEAAMCTVAIIPPHDVRLLLRQRSHYIMS